MKKVLAGLLILVVIFVGGVFLLVSNLDNIVKNVIETAGTNAIGSEVLVGEVELDLLNGIATIRNFSVANPQGFSDQLMIQFDELSIAIDIDSLSGPVTRIDSIIARNPYVLYEIQDGTSNLDAVSARFADDESSADEASGYSGSPQIAIGQITIEGIQASLLSDNLPTALNVNLGTINLQNLEGTPDSIAQQIVRPLMAQLAGNAALALVQATAELLTDNLQQKAGESLEQLEDNLRDAVDDVIGEDIREGLGNLLRRN